MERIVLLFTGQGSQYVGMCKSFYEDFNIVKQTFEEASDVLGMNVTRLCFEGPLLELSKAPHVQPALLTAGVAVYRVYMQEIGISPIFAAGHSLGEYAALTCAGAIRFSDSLKIIKMRAGLTQEITDQEIGSMTIIDGTNMETIEGICKDISNGGNILKINCYNSPAQFSIAGCQKAIEEAEAKLLGKGAQVTPLLMSAPFHTPLMRSVALKLKEELKKCEFYQFKWPVISNVTGIPYGSPDDIPETLALQLIQPVQWQNTMKYLQRFGITIAVEIGMKNILANLVKANADEILPICYGQKEDRKKLSNLLFQEEKMKKESHTVIAKCLTAVAATPNLNHSYEEYHKNIVEPYGRIREMYMETEASGQKPDIELLREALELLKLIFKAKKLSDREQKEWFYRIFDETLSYYTFPDFELPKEC